MRNIISENDYWIKEVFEMLYDNIKYRKLLTIDNVQTTLVIPLINRNKICVNIGIFTQDAPTLSIPVEKMKITYPEARFTITYPTKEYVFSKVSQKDTIISNEIELFEKIFGMPQHNGKYLKNLYQVLNEDNYNEIVSKLLGYNWLSDSEINNEKLSIQSHVQVLAKYFNGAPIELRDYYLKEGEPFFRWMLKYL